MQYIKAIGLAAAGAMVALFFYNKFVAPKVEATK